MTAVPLSLFPMFCLIVPARLLRCTAQYFPKSGRSRHSGFLPGVPVTAGTMSVGTHHCGRCPLYAFCRLGVYTKVCRHGGQVVRQGSAKPLYTGSIPVRASAFLYIIYMDNSIDLRIRGGTTITGTIETGTSKNGSLALLCASLLNHGTTVFRGIADIEEVSRLFEVLRALGVSVVREGDGSVVVRVPEVFDLSGLSHPSFSRIRSGLMLIPGIAHRHTSFSLPTAGGCQMGRRTIAAHVHGLAALGISVARGDDALVVETTSVREDSVVLYEASDTATVNALLAAALVPEVTTISFASANYQVQEVCFFLESLGVSVAGVGTNTLRVHGVNRIDRDVSYANSEDPVESMALVAIGAVTGASLTVTRVPIDFLTLELFVLRSMGLSFSVSDRYVSDNGRTALVDVSVVPSVLRAPEEKIHAVPYPGINTDNLPFFAVIATQAEGETLIHDWMWEDRAVYFTNLDSLGARTELLDPHRVVVRGRTPLVAGDVRCPPALRPASILLVGMLAAEGVSLLRDTYVIRRGHENFVGRLNAIGADISVVES